MNEKILVLKVKNLNDTNKSNEKVYRLHKKRVVIGSGSSSDVRLTGDAIGAVHAILEVTGTEGKPVIYDLASETGVQVNGKSTVQSQISESDEIKIGSYKINVQVQSFLDVKTSPERVKESFGQRLFVSEKEDLAPLILIDEANVVDIFDHSPESKQSLQVVMFFKETILDVEHFVDRKKIVIGPGEKEDFSIPPFFGDGRSGKFDLVTISKGKHFLHLHDKMTGVVSNNGKVTPVKDILGAMASGSEKAYPMGEKDFAKVQFGDVSFFLNFSQAPPKLKLPRPSEKDPLFFQVWLLSLLVTGLMMFGMSVIKVEEKIEIEQLPERLATIIYEPKTFHIPKPKVEDETKNEPEPKKIEVKKVEPSKEEPKEIKLTGSNKKQDKKHESAKSNSTKNKSKAQKMSGQEGAGAKAKGQAGLRGKQNAPKSSVHQDKALRPGAGKPSNAASQNKGNSEVQDLGVVDMFKSDKGTLNKILATGKGVSNAATKLEGYSGFTTKGEGGLGAEGSGKGGGGESMGLGGLAEKGPGGGKKGTGLGALGNGGNLLGGTGKISIESGGSAEPLVMGAIDIDAIARAIARHRDEIKYCYEKEINAQRPDLAGRVAIRFVIGASGTVTTAGMSSSSLRHPPTEICVIEVIKRIQFPQVRGGGIAEVTYPFVFKPSNK